MARGVTKRTFDRRTASRKEVVAAITGAVTGSQTKEAA
jgi:hypothetical protein